MARLTFVTWDGGGNVAPAVGIAQELASRGHEVRFAGYEQQRIRFEALAFEFSPLRRSGGFDIDPAQAPLERLAAVTRNVWACPEHPDDLTDLVAENPTDLVVVDFSMQGALAWGEVATVPVVALAHSTITGLVPPPDSPVGAARLSATNDLRAGAGLQALTRLNDGWARLSTLVTTIPELDPASETASASLVYVGPIAQRTGAAAWADPWDAGDTRPLVLVSFSTTRFWDQTSRVRNTLAGLADQPVRVLVSGAEPTEVGEVPDNAVVRPFVPHGLVLSTAAVTVTHCGHGTVTSSLAHGVPLVGLPNPAADQPYLARRIEELGAGIALEGESDPATISRAVRAVLDQAAYREAASVLAERIAAAPGAAGAATELEMRASAAATVAARGCAR